jgi:hypothetical protein
MRGVRCRPARGLLLLLLLLRWGYGGDCRRHALHCMSIARWRRTGCVFGQGSSNLLHAQLLIGPQQQSLSLAFCQHCRGRLLLLLGCWGWGGWGGRGSRGSRGARGWGAKGWGARCGARCARCGREERGRWGGGGARGRGALHHWIKGRSSCGTVPQGTGAGV